MSGTSDAQVAMTKLARDKGVINIKAEDLQRIFITKLRQLVHNPPPFKDMRQLANEVSKLYA